ncbi:MAG: 6,7-dimethyl-8-ribityllumazine synthase [Pseudomonadota bacterium]
MQSPIDIASLPVIQSPGRIAILKSKWYPDLVQNMADACTQVLTEYGYSQIEQHTLPGSLELPLAARDLLATDVDNTLDAIVCFGIIVKGETLHFEMISYECMRGLGELMHEFRRPVVVEVLPVFEMSQAEARAGNDEFNKGFEAAACAIEMVAWRQSVGATT